VRASCRLRDTCSHRRCRWRSSLRARRVTDGAMTYSCHLLARGGSGLPPRMGWRHPGCRSSASKQSCGRHVSTPLGRESLQSRGPFSAADRLLPCLPPPRMESKTVIRPMTDEHHVPRPLAAPERKQLTCFRSGLPFGDMWPGHEHSGAFDSRCSMHSMVRVDTSVLKELSIAIGRNAPAIYLTSAIRV
jgi:hypothetical protein